jgi:Reverse transcriptase (RNA-dependent DNA polymerase)
MVMFFRLTNSPATFQMMMNAIYKDIIKKHEKLGMTIHVYMDDIGIATSTNLIDHTEAVKDVLQVALDYDLYFKPKKSTFHSPSLDYLGVILEKGVTHMDPVKISSIKEWPTPTKVKDI